MKENTSHILRKKEPHDFLNVEEIGYANVTWKPARTPFDLILFAKNLFSKASTHLCSRCRASLSCFLNDRLVLEESTL